MLRISVLLTIAVLHLFTANCNSICETPECEKFATALDYSVDPKVDACDDFYQHTCGTWVRNHPSDDQSVRPDMKQEFFTRVREILNEDAKSGGVSKLNDARTTYQACTNTNQREKDGLVALNKVIQEVDGWSVLSADEDARKNINWQEISKKIDLYFASSSIYNIFVLPDGAKYTLQLTEPATLLPQRSPSARQNPDPKKVTAYKEYITYVANILTNSRNISLPSTLEQDVKDIVEFETAILRNMSSGYEILELDIFYKNSSLSEFQNEYDKAGAEGHGKVNWKEIINNFLSASNQASLPDHVTVFGWNYYKRLATLLDKTPSHIIAKYKLWNLIRSLLPYTTVEIQDYVSRVEGIISGDAQTESQEERCYEMPNLKHAVNYEYAKRYFPDNQRQKVSDILHAFKNTLREVFNRTSWLTPENKQVLEKQLDDTFLDIGHPFWYNSANIDKYYENLVLSGHSLLENILIIKKFEAIKEQEKLGTEVGLAEWRPAHYLTTSYVDYTRFGTDVDKRLNVYPLGMFNEVLFKPQVPDALNYGTISYWLGYKYSKFFSKLYDILNTTDDTVQDRQNLKKCFADLYKTYVDDNAASRFTYADTHVEANESFEDSVAIALAYATYKRLVKQTEEQLRGHNYNDDQLFFVGIAYSQCESANDSNAHVRVSTSFAGLKEFNEAFKCPADARMNIPTKCEIVS